MHFIRYNFYPVPCTFTAMYHWTIICCFPETHLLCQTHIEDGDDGGVIPADYGGNILCLRDLRGDQLEVKEKHRNRETDGSEGCEKSGAKPGKDQKKNKLYPTWQYRLFQKDSLIVQETTLHEVQEQEKKKKGDSCCLLFASSHCVSSVLLTVANFASLFKCLLICQFA